ncbi:DUF6465 family protein [Clostridium sp. DL1XJH146]
MQRNFSFIVETEDKKFSANDIIVEFKDYWKNTLNRRIKDLKKVEVYFNTSENCAYCVVNDDETIKIQK